MRFRKIREVREVELFPIEKALPMDPYASANEFPLELGLPDDPFATEFPLEIFPPCLDNPD